VNFLPFGDSYEARRNGIEQMHGPAKKGMVVGAVVAVHGVMLIGIASLRPQKRESEESSAGVIFFVEPRRKISAAPVQPSRSERATKKAIEAGPRESENPTGPSDTAPIAIDWAAERSRAAERTVAGERGKSGESRLYSKPNVIELPKGPKSPKAGDSQRFEGGELITWINEKCYATNLPKFTPQLNPDALNVFCKDPSSGRDDYFDHLKPSYLLKEDETRPEMIGIFDEQAKCEYSALTCK
jgi:hypothetical protein